MTTKPNVLFVQSDQLTIDVLSAYNNPIAKTPHIDSIAAKGAVFTDAYCNIPLCSPSRSSMAAGQLGSRVGAYDNACELPAAVPTYAHYMRLLGYRTCLSGKMHFVGPDQHHGFERRLTSDIYPGNFEWTPDWNATGFHGATNTRVLRESGVCSRTVQLDYDDEVTHRAVQEIYDCARPENDRPFFLQVSYTHPHDPYLCMKKHWGLYDDDDIPPPSTPMPTVENNDPHSVRVLSQHGFLNADVGDDLIQQARRAYCGSVSYIDDQLGHLLHALDESGQRDNTIIIFTSDHGEMLGERGLWLKKTFFEAAARVPLIISAPAHLRDGHFSEGRVNTPCSLVDLLPTFANIACDGNWGDTPDGDGITGPIEPLDGEDLVQFITAPNPDRTIYAELLCEGILAPIFMIRQGRYKLITSTGDPDMLFDLESDPHERTNLAGDPAYAETLANLKSAALEMWDSEALSIDVVNSQRRRRLVHNAHGNGDAPVWDLVTRPDDETRWYRGGRNYNDWALDFLPHPSKRDQ
ncbi:choline-sulfatase [Alphaproteobacteria bacterium]|nr:choline-sulfatase [Alphaproteobacteria bacterium]